ncbi:jg4533 [Pararge aegeria aegeria]|uniref:Jg4533 protein n=1 Tax=Pararge aegeria aegeria TaxID=348720 RepID=A0A8S4QU12_9NEOP|nr:jg4533 [Pararge aegeria aegeria]
MPAIRRTNLSRRTRNAASQAIQEQVKRTSNAKRGMKLNGIDGIEINNIEMLRYHQYIRLLFCHNNISLSSSFLTCEHRITIDLSPATTGYTVQEQEKKNEDEEEDAHK